MASASRSLSPINNLKPCSYRDLLFSSPLSLPPPKKRNQEMVGYAVLFKNKEEEMKNKKKKPEWLDLLLRSKFFGSCVEHRDLKKNEINIYCIDCNECMCPHCLIPSSSPHHLHRLLQIRRYVYQDVIRVHDMQKLLDCSKVQPYTVNNAKAVLLKPRKQSKPCKGNTGGTVCEICHRSVGEPNRYCSITCKVSDEQQEEEAIISDVDDENVYNQSGLFISSLSSDLEAYSPQLLSSPQPSDSSEENRGHWMKDALTQKKAIGKRRKGVPHRAPIF